jgi:hypothetical protein
MESKICPHFEYRKKTKIDGELFLRDIIFFIDSAPDILKTLGINENN